MKHALLIYDNTDAWQGLSQEEQQAIAAEYLAISELPAVYGGAQLKSAQTATTVRVGGGETLTTNGPFVAMKEFLGGYYLLETDDLEAALAVAARIPATRMGGAVEVRPIVEPKPL
jgi:hypothetical protein